MANSMTTMIAMASGKGGVGKTSLTLGIAVLLAKQGKKVLVFDGDFGLANADVQLGLQPKKDLAHVLAGQASLAEVVTKSEHGVYLIPGRSGAGTLAFITALEQQGILQQLRTLAAQFDVVLLDVPAGLDETVLGLCRFADHTVVVTTPDPSSITDAYAVMKLLVTRHDYRRLNMVINQAGSVVEGKQTGKKVTTAAKSFLGVEVPVLGMVMYDRAYSTAVKQQQLPVVASPHGKAAEGVAEVAAALLKLKIDSGFAA
ncbi:MAG: AAA family ATPase [Alphaproteobacteria bacterium]